MYYPKPSQRPENFRLNDQSPLARGLLFAGLGRLHGNNLYWDSAARRHGTLTGFSGTGNTPADRWSAALARCVLSFDGSNDYVLVPYTAGMYPGDLMTVAFWAKSAITDYTSNSYVVAQYDTAGGKRQWGVIVRASDDKWSVAASANGTTGLLTGDGSVNVSTGWHHLAMVVDNTAHRWSLFYDGAYREVISDSLSSYANQGSHLTIGGLAAGNRWNGFIADTLLFSRNLTPGEIASIADPANVDLRVGGVPLILPVRRWFPAAIIRRSGSGEAAFRRATAAGSGSCPTYIGSGESTTGDPRAARTTRRVGTVSQFSGQQTAPDHYAGGGGGVALRSSCLGTGATYRGPYRPPGRHMAPKAALYHYFD